MQPILVAISPAGGGGLNLHKTVGNKEFTPQFFGTRYLPPSPPKLTKIGGATIGWGGIIYLTLGANLCKLMVNYWGVDVGVN